MRVLVLSTYPAANPTHGGQHRLNRIVAMLEGEGHQVDLRGVLGSASYQPRSGYVRFPGQATLSRYLPDTTLMEDWAIGRYAADPQGGYEKLSALCAYTYDVVFCEQPWLFDFAFRRFSGGKHKTSFVYGSQNIEYKLKYEIAEQHLTHAAAQRCSELVEETERFAATHADLMVAVSEHDQEWLSAAGPAPVVLAPNGVIDRRPTVADVEKSNEISGSRKFALYCASSHPPNIQGFFDMLGKGVGCFGPKHRLVVAGGAGPSIVADPRFGRVSGLGRKFIAAGEVAENQLRGLLAAAHVIILPITSGGGTNLKTAEALWSGRHVVATTTAMRGFEQFSSARGLAIADDPSSFLSAIEKVMQEGNFQLLPEERTARSAVLWQSTLAPLARAMGQLKIN